MENGCNDLLNYVQTYMEKQYKEPFVLSSVEMIPQCLNNVDVQALRMPIHFFVQVRL